MKYLQSTVFVLIIGSIMATSMYGYQEVYAIEDHIVIEKIIQVDEKLSNLNKDNTKFDEYAMSKISFEVNQIKNMLLDINNLNDGNDEYIDMMYKHLSNEYTKVFNKYKKEIKEYQKEKGLTIQEKKLVSEVFKNKSIFEVNESQQNTEKTEKELIENAVKETKSKKEYHALLNQIGIKLVKETNGNKIQKIHHKIAIKEIMDSKKWEIAIPAIDRVIGQTNDDESKEKLKGIKTNIEKILEKREKQRKDAREKVKKKEAPAKETPKKEKKNSL
ncbi:MAG: hypothetical protein OEW78_00835 [Nitrosopumilus sp.]|uniref:hypothetical protein n=1 Tax=Nitrosopumilus sp. TaxID=2024843 RepID=UPI00246C3681|nr:hypothetical protein [Nitrosopumilus sp.]MDH5430415.1 hypothetical protein [Nitrosopumilus sp.]MDH5697452.1 hypothetical protein [Nitrosopumilus sp.]